jgi:phosphoribosylformimino-5-aminoimidazole carboxamide ribotide isomerase
MAIKVIPALDFIDRKIVRLTQGKFDQVQYFDQSIYDYLDLFKRLNASRVHIVNLLAAKGER